MPGTASPTTKSPPKPDHGTATLMTLLTRVVAPLWVAVIALAQMLGGLSTFPTWMHNLNERWMGVPDSAILRGMIGLEVAAVAMMLLLGRAARATAIVILGGACFVAIAELVGLGLSLDALGTMTVLLISGTLLAGIGLPEGMVRPPPASGPVLASTGAAVLAAVALAVVLPLQPAPPKSTHTTTPTTPQPAEDGHVPLPLGASDFAVPGELIRPFADEDLPQFFVMEPEPWIGVPVQETNWHRFLPEEIQAALQSGDRLVAFYNPNNTVSHALFDGPMSIVNPSKIIAVRVPPSPQQPPVQDTGLGPIRCDGCSMAALPTGPMWFFPNGPVLFRVVDGVVKCTVTGIDELAIESCLYSPDLGPIG